LKTKAQIKEKDPGESGVRTNLISNLEKNERRGKNPATGTDMLMARRKVVTFKCSGKLRDKIKRQKIILF